MTRPTIRSGVDRSRSWWAAGRWKLWFRYGASSVIAGVISEATFALTFWLGATATAASLIAFVAGAVPNYLMNRYWAWGRRDRIGGARELLPYLVIILSTALVATLITNAADAVVRGRVEDHLSQTVLVSAAFLLTYGVMFVIKFFLFDRLIFAGQRRTREAKSRS